jgi:hypothetical protein
MDLADTPLATRILCSLSDFAGAPATHMCVVYTGQAAPVRAACRMSRLAWLTWASRNTRASSSREPGSARTVTMPHRCGPDRINVTSSRFVNVIRPGPDAVRWPPQDHKRPFTCDYGGDGYSWGEAVGTSDTESDRPPRGFACVAGARSACRSTKSIPPTRPRTRKISGCPSSLPCNAC